MKSRPIRVWRVVCLSLIFASAGFLILHGAQRTAWYKDRLYRQLLNGTSEQRTAAAVNLTRLGAESHLLRGLQSEIRQVRDLSQRGVEHLWFAAAGTKVYRQLENSYEASDRGDLVGALEIINQVVQSHPDFAEGWNRRASLHYALGETDKSMADCRRALALNPNHYGAWQGLGVCQLEKGRFKEACESLRSALKIIPHDQTTRQSLRQCEELLYTFPQPETHRDKKGHLVI